MITITSEQCELAIEALVDMAAELRAKAPHVSARSKLWAITEADKYNALAVLLDRKMKDAAQ